jgi:hypothetical protein
MKAKAEFTMGLGGETAAADIGGRYILPQHVCGPIDSHVLVSIVAESFGPAGPDLNRKRLFYYGKAAEPATSTQP